MVCDWGISAPVRVGDRGVFDGGAHRGCVCGAGRMGCRGVYGVFRVVGVWVYDLAESVGVAEVAGGV